MHPIVCIGLLAITSWSFVLDAQAQDPPQQQPSKIPCFVKSKEKPPRPTESLMPPAYPKELDLRQLEYLAKQTDTDCDGISNYYDKCRSLPITNNRDSDGDGWGDPCDKVSSDVSISLFTSKTRVKVGSQVRVEIVVTNHGPTAKAGILNIESQVSEFMRISSVQTNDGQCDEIEGSVRCAIDEMAVGSRVSIVILATAIRPGKTTTRATVENGIGDLYRRNNKARADFMISR